MAERPVAKAAIREWTGLVSNRGPLSGKPGDALEQTNCHSVMPGVLQPRKGLQVVEYDGVADIGSDGDVISLTVLDKPEGTYAVTLTTDGKLAVGNNPQVP